MDQLLLLQVGLKHFLFVGAMLFGLGTYTVLTRKNAVGVLMGVELILNAANINLVAFAHYVTGSVGGQVFALIVIVVAAAEAAIALAIVLSIFQTFHTIDATQADLMKN
jgi:NADH-quinone oxidoreductase subunit K